MSDLDCRNELVARERRGELSAAERVALDAHLAQCASCRLSRLVGRDFEAEATIEADDGVRIAALSTVAERWTAGQGGSVTQLPLKRRRTRIALLAVAAALAAVGASAASGTWSKIFGGEPAQAPDATATATATDPAKPVAKSASDGKPEAVAASRETSEPRARSQATVESAASLLNQASNARRAGELDRAIALYRRLQNEFPSSPEAGLAALPLGGLLLDRGEARSALTQFDRHVRAGRSSRLLPEAYYGRGRALAALGNRSEERRTWTTLLDQFPESPYAGHAKRRLAELKAAD
jgi:TolA-binding protein